MPQNTSKDIRILENTSERPGTFQNLSTFMGMSYNNPEHPEMEEKDWKPWRTFRNNSEPSQIDSEHPRMSKDTAEPSGVLTTIQNPRKHLRTSQNFRDDLEPLKKNSELLTTHENASEHIEMHWNVRECLRSSRNFLTTQNLREPLRIL